MSDQSVAYVGRKLALALRWFARTRADDARKEIGRLQTELCQSLRDEENYAAERELAAQEGAPAPVI